MSELHTRELETRKPHRTMSAEQDLDFDAIQISVASPEDILEWSHGEITKPETINYRTQRPERDGLFDERIFGPTRDWECYCGKYKKIRYKGIVCDKCGVEVTRSSVRRERMGHITLAVPVAHIWYVRGVPSVLGLLLNLTVAELEKVIYFASFIILDVNEELRLQALEDLEAEYKEAKEVEGEDEAELTRLYKETKAEIEGLRGKLIITEAKAHDISLKYGQIARVGIGAEAIYELLQKFDLSGETARLEEEVKENPAHERRLMRRLKLLRDLSEAKIKPAWMITTHLPVIPPDLRPMVQLDGGRFAASDLNDLYRRVINRNNRLRRLIAQGAPEVINRNEKRMLQEAVDALIDNSARRGRAVVSGTQRRLRSLSDMLRGKQGRFRQNLLGKRVDYSGRSVIVVGPDLKLDQCGLPKVMALELFKPFVISRLIRDGHAHNIKSAQRMIERREEQVWDILESITKESFVLLNRAPTLHRLGIQAFRPLLIEGKAIQIHPLVTYAYNADFDGDMMAVHVPLSTQAMDEAKTLMWSKKNLLKPASGEPVVSPRLDIVLGCYTLTTLEAGAKGEGKIFASKNEAIFAHHMGNLHVRAPIKVRMKKAGIAADASDRERYELVETSVGRILFNNILPEELRFINEPMDMKRLKKVVAECFKRFDQPETAALVDRIMRLGFEQAGLSGMTISMDDIYIPAEKPAILKEGDANLAAIDKQFQRGLITDSERSAQVIKMWEGIKTRVERAMLDQFPKESPVYIMMTSGARGTLVQVTQMAGMKGLVSNPSGQIIEIPVKGNFKEGLSVLEFFISSHGARKGKSDGALRTADAGYLTRRLVDVSQDLVVAIADCETTEGLTISRAESEEMGEEFATRLGGRLALDRLKLPDSKKPLVQKNELITETLAAALAASDLDAVTVRSVVNCRAAWGICQNCYGRDLATGELVKIGEAVGIMAAQAIGEPGTQLTLKTFQTGGVSGDDITSGLPRVEELFEARLPKRPAILAELAGQLEIRDTKEMKTLTITSTQRQSVSFTLGNDYQVTVVSGDQVTLKQAIATAPNKKAVRSTLAGKVAIAANVITVTSLEPTTVSYEVSSQVNLKVKAGEIVALGQELTEGHWDLGQALTLRGKLEVQRYIVRGVQEIYSSQGQTINDKHIEIIIRQLFSKVRVSEGGDSNLLAGQILDRTRVTQINQGLKAAKKRLIEVEEIILGITRVALKTESFLSAASFQETTGVLLDAAVRGAVDPLRGLKENVIIGKLIPAGTGFRIPSDTLAR
jgi:DNA-directed RNA polymerase subunit beta'